MNKIGLKDLILSPRNIYNAIYALRSYVFEKGLMTESDVVLYRAMSDRFDFDTISKEIVICQNRINELLTSDRLFDVQVFFKLKKYKEDTDKYEFRPIHTASLTDQICMVSMLMPLMFNDTSGERKLSEISKLIPHNFYGNLPSLKVEEIFERWQRKYKCYSDEIVKKSREFKETKQYQYDVNLDLKDFFPSIDPAYIFNLVKKELKLVIEESDYEMLEKVLTKLLYFHIDKENLKGWELDYYKKDIESEKYDQLMNRGIAQGLPQAYFFGNLMMLDISQEVSKVFPGEAYYYVDDSVVFTNDVKSETDFNSKIRRLNKRLAELHEEIPRNEVLCHLNDNDRKIQESLLYRPQYHEAGKSFYVEVEDSYSGSGGLQYIARQVSLAAVFSNNTDEIDDQISKDKLRAILEVIDNELEKERKKVEKGADESKLKLIKRHRRFFLYRYRLLQLRENGEVSDDYLNSFIGRYQFNAEKINGGKLTETLDEEIFQAESRLIVNWANEKLAQNFIESVTMFELKIAVQNGRATNHMYYNKDLRGALLIKRSDANAYASLDRWCKKAYASYRYSKPENQQREIENFLKGWKNRWILREPFFPLYTEFAMRNSEEFVRMVMNAFFSTLFVVDITDRHHFSKNNNRTIKYDELRILAYLRNHQFNKVEFERFVYDVQKSDNRMEKSDIDMALMDVLHVLITTVKKPQYVDHLIQTHRLVNGLWKNGSKFLNAYTLHNEEHAITLMKQSIKLMKVIDYIGIKQDDYYILFLACYLHDISMVIHPNIMDFNHGDVASEKIVSKTMANFLRLDKRYAKSYHDKFRNLLIDVFTDVYDYFENEKRSKHPKDSAMYIRQQHSGFLRYIEKSILEIVASVSESHGYDSVEVYGLKSAAKDELYSVKYMMILIRLADLMDMTSARVNYYRLRQNLDSLSKVSKFHWISHLITDEAYITAQYEVDKNKRLNQQPITETIQIVIKLNVDYSAVIKPKDVCKGCQASHQIALASKNMRGYRQTILEIGEKDQECSCYTGGTCPIICAWMANKNYYLRNELVELKRYLNQANSKMFNTKVELVLQYQDTGNSLDNDMFDVVYSYLTDK